MFKCLEEFAGATSLTGIPVICGEGVHVLRRALWFVIYAGSCAVLLYMLGTSLQQYRGYKTLTTTTLDVSGQHIFPEIRICKVDSFKPSSVAIDLNYTPENATILKELMLHYSQGLESQLTEAQQHIVDNTPASDILQKAFFIPNDWTTSNPFEGKSIIRGEVGSKPFIEECGAGYKGSEKCNVSTIPYISYNDQMICQILHSPEYQEEFGSIVATKTGDKYGIKLLLNVHSPDMNVDNGRVYISFGDMDVTRTSISFTGFEQVYIGLEKTETKFLPVPYSVQDCYTDEQSAAFARDNLLGADTDGYTQSKCIHQCLEEQRFSSCNCTFSSQEPRCRLDVWFLQDQMCDVDENRCTDCKPRCNIQSYDYLFTSVRDLEDYSNYMQQTTVYIYFSSFTTTTTEQVEAIDLMQLFSNFGGLIGVFVGFSLLNLVESVDIVLDKLTNRQMPKRKDDEYPGSQINTIG